MCLCLVVEDLICVDSDFSKFVLWRGFGVRLFFMVWESLVGVYFSVNGSY